MFVQCEEPRLTSADDSHTYKPWETFPTCPLEAKFVIVSGSFSIKLCGNHTRAHVDDEPSRLIPIGEFEARMAV